MLRNALKRKYKTAIYKTVDSSIILNVRKKSLTYKTKKNLETRVFNLCKAGVV